MEVSKLTDRCTLQLCLSKPRMLDSDTKLSNASNMQMEINERRIEKGADVKYEL